MWVYWKKEFQKVNSVFAVAEHLPAFICHAVKRQHVSVSSVYSLQHRSTVPAVHTYTHTHVHTLRVKAAIVHTQDIQYPLIQAWKWLSVRPVSVSPSPRSFTKFLLIIFKRSLCQRGLCFLACLWNAAALWHSIPLFCWKTLNHGVTSLPILRKSSLASYLTLTLDVASHHPTDMVSIITPVVMVNIWSVVKGLHCRSPSQRSNHFNIYRFVPVGTWIILSSTVCVWLLYLQSIKVVAVSPSFPSSHLGVGFFFPSKRNNSALWTQRFLNSICGFTKPLNSDPHDSLYASLAEEKEALSLSLTWEAWGQDEEFSYQEYETAWSWTTTQIKRISNPPKWHDSTVVTWTVLPLPDTLPLILRRVHRCGGKRPRATTWRRRFPFFCLQSCWC